MNSIRRTLLLNVLLLLVVTLGAVSYFVYRTAEGALRERQRTAREIVELRVAHRQDQELKNRADELAGEVQSNFHRDKFRDQWLASELSALAAPISPCGQAPLVTRLAAFAPGPLGFDLNARLSTELRLSEEDSERDAISPAHEFIQVTSDSGGLWTSRSLAGHVLGPDEATLRKDSELPGARFSTTTLPDGTPIRRIVVKAPVTRFSRVGSFWLPRPPRTEESPPPSRAVIGLASVARSADRRGPGPGPGGPGSVGSPSPFFGPPPSASNPGGYSLPNFYLHCAWSTSPDNPRFAALLHERDQQLSEIDEETGRAVGSLRSTLAWTVGGSVAATLILGWFLVGLGLFPLKRLSFAVSQISPKDFHLPLDPNTLPSELNPVAERLSQALTELQAAFEREKRAAADISHELRTPLAALTTTIEVACRKARTAEQYRQTLDDCRGIARQMSLLVERMLTLAWIDAGVDQIRPEQVDVGELVGGVAAIGKPLAEVQGLTFRVNLKGVISLRTDPDKVREVVMNLIHNAIEYNQPGGEVEVSAVKTSQGGVVLEVSDTGIGMSDDTQKKIFERFFRGDPSRQATGVHAGLGLAIVKEYVDRLGGRLSVESAIGRGSRFRVELPNAT
jgi:signal transduction histidine kinase/HAMP domain-containing protein